MGIAERVSENLARARKQADLSQEELGVLASLHRTEISLVERGARLPRIDTVIKLAAAMKIPLETLIEGIEWSPGSTTLGQLHASRACQGWRRLMAEGIRKRHSKGCSVREGGRCNCKAGWEASVYLAREGRKLRRSFSRESEARSWRRDALAEADAGLLRTPSQITVEQAAWLWLEAARTGAVRDRSGHPYKPATLREYARVLSLRVLPGFGAVSLCSR